MGGLQGSSVGTEENKFESRSEEARFTILVKNVSDLSKENKELKERLGLLDTRFGHIETSLANINEAFAMQANQHCCRCRLI